MKAFVSKELRELLSTPEGKKRFREFTEGGGIENQVQEKSDKLADNRKKISFIGIRKKDVA